MKVYSGSLYCQKYPEQNTSGSVKILSNYAECGYFTSLFSELLANGKEMNKEL